ncbi:hypothetical protein E2C01_035345 [Portunus trituberculatus]|uniref:Uncharacterized protein n=1 Tax=Portunus trituberculatus TaxID=210409 RepID=A0A5B7F5G6_PORTR|nr:hypothetical protein [Portunus trituberculatus]
MKVNQPECVLYGVSRKDRREWLTMRYNINIFGEQCCQTSSGERRHQAIMPAGVAMVTQCSGDAVLRCDKNVAILVKND